ENPDGKPVVVVLPRSNEPKVSNLTQKLIALLLFIATLSTCLIRGGIQSGFNLVVDWQRVSEALPITIGLLVVLMSHELGHWWVARHHQVRLSWPFFLPTWEIGSFGAITRFESILPNRSVLFDISIAGPLCGGLVSITMLIIGLFLSRGEAPIQVPSAIFEGSLLVSALAKTILGESLQEGTITIHPLTIIGWVGLVITALNVMPAGQLDGGRIIQAIYGRKMAGRTSFATLIILGLGALFNALALYWAVVILVLQQGQERPSLNDITEPDDSRAALALLM
ncbi:MAG: site-2 protease family protein, partial [Synechococcales cyanobacterium]